MVSEIINFYSYNDKLAAGGQPTEEQIKDLKSSGFEAIIRISPTSTENYLPSEAELTIQQDINFVQYLIDCTNLKTRHYKVFRSRLSELEDKKVFVYCGGNIKSSKLIHLYNVLEIGMMGLS